MRENVSIPLEEANVSRLQVRRDGEAALSAINASFFPSGTGDVTMYILVIGDVVAIMFSASRPIPFTDQVHIAGISQDACDHICYRSCNPGLLTRTAFWSGSPGTMSGSFDPEILPVCRARTEPDRYASLL